MEASNKFRNLSELRKPAQNLHTRTKRLKNHPVELALLWIAGSHFVFLPWAFGTMRPWSQWISFGFSLASLAIALLPRNYTSEHTGSEPFRLLTYPKLLRFPIFWLGLAILVLVVIQGLNPAFSLEYDGKIGRVYPEPYKEWLPHGVRAPWGVPWWNQWRTLMIWAAGLMTICALWIGFTRRRTLQLFLISLAVNGLLVGLFGIAEQLFGNGKIYWFVPSRNPQFFATFVYKNHGGAYLDLALAVTAGLTGWFYLRGLRRMEKSNPSGVLAFFVTCIAVSVITSYSRGATLVMIAFVIIWIGSFIVHQIIIPGESRKPLITVALLLLFGFFLNTGLDAVGSDLAWNRLKTGFNGVDRSLQNRELVAKASLEMLHEHWKFGVGAASYRYTFPSYQQRHPEVKGYWEHAHNDILQFPIELGVIGTGLILGGLGFWVRLLFRHHFWKNPVSGCLVLGLVMLLAYSWWDFPFQCPAVLIPWCSLWACAVMWAQFEESSTKGQIGKRPAGALVYES